MTTVLIIENDPICGRQMAAQFQRADFEVLEAATGMEGLGLLWVCPIDMVVCASTLPDLDGYSILEVIREFRDGELHMPVFFTGMEKRALPVFGGRYNPDCCLPKPLDYYELIASAREHLENAAGSCRGKSPAPLIA